MRQSRQWLLAAADEWHRGDPLETGRILYERLAPKDRPSWAARVLDACCLGLPPVPAEVRDVREIAFTPTRWGDAHRAFQEVRKLVLAAERQAPEPAPEVGVLYLAENVAKVEHVGDHFTSVHLGSQGGVKPFSEHAKFYDAYEKRAPVDYSRNPVLGWFEL
jgi:hypothetical protein